jgi:hypothetical protein
MGFHLPGNTLWRRLMGEYLSFSHRVRYDMDDYLRHYHLRKSKAKAEKRVDHL